MPPKLRIALISRDLQTARSIELHLLDKGYHVVATTNLTAVLGLIYTDPPDLVIIDLVHSDDETRRIVRELKGDSNFSVIPIIGIFTPTADESYDWTANPIDDFVSHPVNYAELYNRIALSQNRIQRIFDNNPLTKLPGNTSIQHAIEQALGRPMAVCYIDINNFKPYNDTYGFSRGDDVIRMVARIMANVVRESGDGGFVGHVGGDDYVFIVPLDRAEAVCQRIIDNFTIIVSDLFGEEDKTRGYYLAKDRKDQEQLVPLLGIAIAVVPTDNPRVQHAGKVAEMAAELKKYAKQSLVSRYVVERRGTAR